MDDLNTLRMKRGQLKGQITRFDNFYNDLNLENLDDNLVKELSNRLNKVQTVFDKFDEIQSGIELLDPNEINSNERLSFENSFFAITSKAESLLEKHFKNVISEENDNRTSVSSGGTVFRNIKLPTIKLPQFNGEYNKWLEFRDMFNALVNGNESLSSIEKFYHLKSSLSEEPRKIISKLDTTADNYEIAWQLLNDRYENKNIMIYNHIKSIFEKPPMRKESHFELRDLSDTINDHLLSLKSLGENTDEWDRLIIYLMTKKFDETTHREWESFKLKGDIPTMEDMGSFIKERCKILEKLHNDGGTKFKHGSAKYDKFKKQNTSYSLHSMNVKCYFCNENHSMYTCEEFLKYSVPERINEVKKRKLCFNCFSPSHAVKECRVRKCIKCKKSHNSLIHENKPELTNQITTDFKNIMSTNESTDNCLIACPVASQVLLSTAVIKLKVHDQMFKARVLLDSGSQSNFITESLCDILHFKKKPIMHTVKGLGEGIVNIKYQVNFTAYSCHNNYSVDINCLVLNKITEGLPKVSFNKSVLKLPPNLNLADPTFNQTSDIDILIGSQIFWQILSPGQHILGKNLPILQNSQFGWIIAGNVGTNSNYSLAHVIENIENDNVNKLIEKFWKIENIADDISKGLEEEYCERYFSNTIERDICGRFIVRMPFSDKLKNLGNSLEIAKTRFLSLEKRLSNNSDLKREYVKFMNEYSELGHMTEVKLENIESLKDFEQYFIPHHAVLKESSKTTKLRVVFNASCPTSTGLSLNDVQYAGGKLQDDLFVILMRYRIPKYVIAADITKMFRQVKINAIDRPFQKIIWRSDPHEAIKYFELSTVTYGMKSAAWLAVRSLWQAAYENREKYPLAYKKIVQGFYMDDFLSGADTKSEVIQIQREVSEILSMYGFELRKWLCNDEKLLKEFFINPNLDHSILKIGEHENNKTLGIVWDAKSDFLQYSVYPKCFSERLTKRHILSMVCQIYDPLGLINPVVVTGKLFMQEIWKINQSWDDDVPENIKNLWLQYQKTLVDVNNIRIPRLCVFTEYISIELHAFSDASEKAYGGAIYIRCVTPNEEYFVNLLCAKSRVAPLKQISLPRLELCGAVLLANLAKKVLDALKINFNKRFYWTDSTIVLSWIRAEPKNWNTFVANRVSEIQGLTDILNWFHVKGKENPADLLSRGATPQELKNSDLWWHGPQFLKLNQDFWKLESNRDIHSEIPERRKTSSVLISISEENPILKLINEISNFSKLKRVTAYVLRFIGNIRRKKDSQQKCLNSLTTSELDNALIQLVKVIQIISFPQEYNCLLKGKEIPVKSKILSLNPFLQNEIIRVGGRIDNAICSFSRKHPILLPKNNLFTELIVRHEHLRLLHCGCQMLLSSIREMFWPINGKNVCKKIIRTCLTCFRVKPVVSNYQMGNLPPNRVIQSLPFLNVGIDYGGPFFVKDWYGRSSKTFKCYIALFICMCTKAVHLEIVTDLTTSAFIACLKRFMSRRGKPANIYSDNGSNFVGANRVISDMYRFLETETDNIASQLSEERVIWHFIPANSPTFGGLWEAGIKNAKYYLKRVIGDSVLPCENFMTILIQVEGILNSRPLCPLSNNPDDCTALTPAHLLIGRSLVALPEEDVTAVPISRLKHLQKIQFIVSHFWKRWHLEYLSELQKRSKWKTNGKHRHIAQGMLVLVQDDRSPPFKWPLGRITATYPGKDDVIRVVDVKTLNGTYRRAVTKICPIPIE